MSPMFVFLLAFAVQQTFVWSDHTEEDKKAWVMSDEEKKVAFQALYNSTANAFGGDMILSKGQKASMKARNANPNFAVRWPNGVIPYWIDPSLTFLTSMIEQAAEHIRSVTGDCIKFVPWTNEVKYVRMFLGTGCNSWVGMYGSGGQDLSLGNGCHYIGTVIHEMLHAVGFDHEQNRPDRDNYLNIYWDNIQPDFKFAFNKVDRGVTYTDFDFDSVMLYGDNAFAIDYSKSTMLDKTGQRKLLNPYDKTVMTEWDAYEVKRYYDCPI